MLQLQQESHPDKRGDSITIRKTAIVDQLQHMLNNPQFKATNRQKKFLQFVVENSFSNNPQIIKGYTIATTILDRGENFNQATDSIVSVEAGRLRHALEYYYLTAGHNDPLRINIPKGGYRPTFTLQHKTEASVPTSYQDCVPAKDKDTECWPTVLIRPLQSICAKQDSRAMAHGFTTELSIELSRYQDIQVIFKSTGTTGETSTEPQTRFLIDGTMRYSGSILKVAIQLFDLITNKQLWADDYKCDLATTDIITFQEEITQVIAAKIAAGQGFIAKTIAKETVAKPLADITTYEAILKYYVHDLSFSKETMATAIKALQQAVHKSPENARCWAILGRLFLENYCIETCDKNTPIKKAITYTKKAVQLDQGNHWAHIWLAAAYLINDQLPEGRHQLAKATSLLPPNSLMCFDLIGHFQAFLGDWQTGTAIIRKHIKRIPYYFPFVHNVLCIDWLNQGEYEKAYMETLNFRVPLVFWDPMLQAVSLAYLTRLEESHVAIQKILHLKPDFTTQGRRLIGYYVKEEAIQEKIIHGLHLAGLELS